MFKVCNGLGFAAMLVAVLLWAGVCLGEISIRSPEAQVREGDRQVDIFWKDPDPEALVSIDEPVLGTPHFPWDGHATLSAQGFYTGGCDWTYTIIIMMFQEKMEFSWSEISDWGTKEPTPRRITVTETDHFYDLSDGIQVMINSAGLFEADMAGWNGPVPEFHGIYAPDLGWDPDSALVFTFACISGGELHEVGGDAVGFDWSSNSGASGSFEVARAGTSVNVSRGFKAKFGPGTYSSGESFSVDVLIPLVDQDLFTIRAETFDGYLVLRHSIEDRPPHEPADSIRHYKVIAEISKCDTFEFFEDANGDPAPDSTRSFTDRGILTDAPGVTPDPDVHTVINGFPYQYAVATYDWTDRHEQAISDLVWQRVFPAASPAATAKHVRVVPNPYVRRAGWEVGGESKIQFVNIPREAKIRIYDASGGYINTVRPNVFSYDPSAPQGTADWNLKDSDGKSVVSGIYLYRIESDSGSEMGRFVIVR